MMPISYQRFFFLCLHRFNAFRTFYGQLKFSHINGAILRVYLVFDLVPFEFSVFLKTGGYKYFKPFFESYLYEGVCVAFRPRYFGSSITLRLIDEGIQFDRSFLVFSPVLFFIQVVYRPNFFYSEVRPRRSKFFFLKAHSQKKLISRLFF